MGGLIRTMALAVRFNWASKVKFLLLAVLVAVGMAVFLIVTELSRVSAEDLDEAIAAEAGETGTYNVQLSSSLGLAGRDLAARVAAAVAPYAARPPDLVQVMPAITPECPPYESLGSLPIFILRDAVGDPAALPFGRELPLETEFCFDGQEIPVSAIYLPNPQEQAKWGSGLFVDGAYERVVALSSTDPVQYRWAVVTGQRTDLREELSRAVMDELADPAQRYGVDVRQTVFVSRLDAAAGIRSASEGIKLVYAIIAWGVLVLGGLGLLVAELIVVRDRTWFFGLARSLGARGRHVVALIFADILLVLGVGTLLALVVAVAVQPVASSFAREAFQVEVDLLQASTIPKLVAGVVLVLGVAGVYPALVATRQDPLDVLEGRAG